jgi:hypothetical protein
MGTPAIFHPICPSRIVSDPLAHATNIDRHAVDPDPLRDDYEEEVAEQREQLGARPLTFALASRLIGHCARVFNHGSVIEPTSTELRRLIGVNAKIQTALLASSCQPPESDVPITWIDGERLTIKAKGPNPRAHVVRWEQAWYAATMARDEASLGALAAIDDAVLAASGNELDDYHYAWKAALIASRNEPHSVAASLDRAREAFARLSIADPASAATDLSLFDALERLVRNDSAAFMEALSAALVAHAQFWSSVEQAEFHDGWVAWGATALACLARDRGWPIEVTSGYLPAVVVENTVR